MDCGTFLTCTTNCLSADGPGSVGNVTDPKGRSRPSVKKGGNITFSCVVKSTPPAIINWYKDGIPIWKAMPQSELTLY